MAKRQKPISHPDRHWEVRDAMHTVMRAHDVINDKKLMKEVKKHAKYHAAELKETAARAEHFAKMGRISPKQMGKLGSKISPRALRGGVGRGMAGA